MALLRTLLPTNVRAARAFTLIEIVTVIGIFTVLMGATVVVGISGFREYSFHSDRDMLIAALQRARAEAIGNVCLGTACTDGKPHGVAILSDAYVIFQGASYATRDTAVDESLDAAPGITRAGSTEIVFTQLSGVATPQPWSLTLSDVTGRSSTITIGSEGRVAWTN